MSRSSGFLLTLLLLLGPAAVGQSPPEDLHLVGDHWTAWDPPSSFPEGAELYMVVIGDTLWDLSARFLGDPYLWPQIWERNQYVLDAHWIYPGDPLLLGIQVTSSEELEQITEVSEEPPVEIAVQPPSSPYPIVQLGHADDIYCSGYIGESEESFPFRVSGSEYEILGPTFDIDKRGKLQAEFGVVDTIKYGLSVGDIVYLGSGRTSGVVAGDVFSAIVPGVLIRHPSTGRQIGQFYSYSGRIRVLSVQETSAIAEIVQSCSFTSVGAKLKPFEAEPVPSRRKPPMRPASYPTSLESLDGSPLIVYAKDGLVVIGKDHVVFIDQGLDHGLAAGDLLTIYRRPRAGGPPLVLGEIALLSVREVTSSGKVVESRHPIYVGDIAVAN